MLLRNALKANGYSLRWFNRLASWFAFTKPGITERLCVVLTAIAVAAVIYGLFEAKLIIADNLGLISGLPIFFFFGFTLLIIASILVWSSQRFFYLALFQLGFAITTTYLAPLVVSGPTGGFESYGHLYYVMRYGHTSPEVLWVHNWPAIFIWLAIIFEILGIGTCYKEFEVATSLAHVMWPLAFLLMLGVFLKVLHKNEIKYVWAGLWWFFLTNWTNPPLLNQNTAGFFLFLFLVFLSAKNLTVRNDTRISLIVIVVFAAIVAVHALSAIGALAYLTVVYLSERKKLNFVALAAVFSIWLIFGARLFFESYLLVFLNRFYRLDVLPKVFLERSTIGSVSHIVVSRVRILLTALSLGGGLFGWWLGRRYVRERADRVVWFFVVAVATFIGVMGAGYVPHVGEVLEIVNRLFLFVLPCVAYFVAKLTRFRLTTFVLCVLLISSAPLQIIARYGNQNFDHVSLDLKASASFFEARTSGGTIVRNDGSHLTFIMRNPWTYHFIMFDEWTSGGGNLSGPMTPVYVGLNYREKAFFVSRLGYSTDFYASRTAYFMDIRRFDLVYCSGDAKLLVQS